MGLYCWILSCLAILFLVADRLTDVIILIAASAICAGLDRIEKAIRERS